MLVLRLWSKTNKMGRIYFWRGYFLFGFIPMLVLRLWSKTNKMGRIYFWRGYFLFGFIPLYIENYHISL